MQNYHIVSLSGLLALGLTASIAVAGEAQQRVAPDAASRIAVKGNPQVSPESNTAGNLRVDSGLASQNCGFLKARSPSVVVPNAKHD